MTILQPFVLPGLSNFNPSGASRATLNRQTRPVMHNTMKTTISKHILPALLCCLCTVPSLRAEALEGCLEPGQWARPTIDGAAIATVAEVMAATQEADIVLLGEAHDNADHHLWQLQALGMLHGPARRHDHRHGDVPSAGCNRRWTAGLRDSSVKRNYSGNLTGTGSGALIRNCICRYCDSPGLNKLRLVALNVERSLIAETGASGWGGSGHRPARG